MQSARITFFFFSKELFALLVAFFCQSFSLDDYVTIYDI